ncbi:hypothetical protein V1511DRAFT_503017 [Dipodascopsis uninucleata]
MFDERSLCRFLKELPSRYNFVYTSEAKRSLLRALFNFMSDNGKFLSYFFPHGPPPMTEEWKMKATETDPAHPGRPCMHQFQKGEPTYRCKECGLDETCVLCWRCFNASDHIGHSVTISISQKDGGGVCDCGDPEAWLQEFNCKYYKAEQLPLEPLPPDLQSCIRATVSRALDYMFDIMSCSPQSYQDCKDESFIMRDFESFHLDPKIYGGDFKDNDNSQFALILWNDEKHSVKDVTDVVTTATHRREEYGLFIANEVDRIGRRIVSTSSDIRDLIDARVAFDRIQLAVSIRSTRDTFREDMCGTILEWLNDMASSSLMGHHFALRDIICEALCQPWQCGSTATRIRQPLYQIAGHFDDSDDDLSMGTAVVAGVSPNNITGADPVSATSDSFSGPNSAGSQNMAVPSYWLNADDEEYNSVDQSTFPPFLRQSQVIPSSSSSQEIDYFAPATSPVSNSNTGFGDSKASLRLDYLMLFDMRFWKSARYTTRDLLMATMISNLDYKMIMGMRFIELYPTLIELYMLADREPDCSMILLSTQLFTCPTIATEIARKHFTTLIAALYTYLTTGRVGPPKSVDLTASVPDDRRTLKNRRLQQIFIDLDHIINRNTIKQRISGDERRMHQIADLFILFEGCAPFMRQINEHVEYESTEWVSFFQILSHLLKLGRAIAKDCGDASLSSTKNSVRTVSRMLTAWALGFLRDRLSSNEITDEPHFESISAGDFSHAEYPIVNYPVEFYSISIHHPLHALMSWIIEFAGFESANQLKSLLSFSILDPPAVGKSIIYGPEDMLMLMLDYPLRTLVAIAQIRVGLWVRNGYTLRTHQVHYRDLTMRENGYARDIFNVQMMMSICNPSRVMLTIVERWSLTPWLKGSVEHSAFDETKLLYVMEEFLHSMIVLLSERYRLLGNSCGTTNEQLIQREIIQLLCFEPMAFSDITRKVPEYLVSDESFEKILREVTNFRAPEGLNDFGTYELHPSCIELVDPYFFHYTPTQWDAAETAVKNSLHKKTNIPVEKIVIKPHLIPITSGPFSRLGWIVGTPEFAQMIFVTLSNIIFQRLPSSSTLPESLLSLTLHLCYIASIEDNISIEDPERKLPSFAYNSCILVCQKVGPRDDQCQTILEALYYIRSSQKYEAHKALVLAILEQFKLKEPTVFDDARVNAIGFMEDVYGIEVADTSEESPVERKKRLAKERQAKIMAEFQKQQQSFVDKNKDSMDDGDQEFFDEDDDDAMVEDDDDVSTWKFPSGMCILCRKPSTDTQMYGTVGYITESTLFRQTVFKSEDQMNSVIEMPSDLDRPVLEESDKLQEVKMEEEDTIGPGFPSEGVNRESVAVGCGHIMHFSCYEEYKESINIRHRQHITRNPPEKTEKGEFLCPLCKSLNNCFFPLIFKGIRQTFDSQIQTKSCFMEWISEDAWTNITRMKCTEDYSKGPPKLFREQVRQNFMNSLSPVISDMYLQKLNSSSVTGWLQFLRDIREDSQRLQNSNEGSMLHKVYADILEVLAMQTRLSCGRENQQSLSTYHRMIKLYGSTISSAEIALRGANRSDSQRDVGMTILDQVSQRTMTLLRILRSTVLTYGSLGVVNGSGNCAIAENLSRNYHQQIGKLFFGQECMYDKNSVSCPDIVLPLLLDDVFVFLAEASVCLVPAMDLEIHHVMVLCYIAQVVKVLFLLGQELRRKSGWLQKKKGLGSMNDGALSSEKLAFLRDAIGMIMERSGNSQENIDDILFDQELGTLVYSVLEKLVLPFLRKSAVLISVSGAIGVEEIQYSESVASQKSETDRLLSILRLPVLDEILCILAIRDSSDSDFNAEISGKMIHNVVTRWLRHLELALKRPFQRCSVTTEYPGIMELVRLPRLLHGFFQKVGQLRCKNCGKCPEEPAVCLFCAELVCCQSYCCVKNNKGECNQHMQNCAGYVGIYLLIKKCTIFFLRDGQGSFVSAPYLDIHGEVDTSLKRGRPLYLSQRRYTHLIRNVWLQNGITSQIARKIEGMIDNGGWEGM